MGWQRHERVNSEKMERSEGEIWCEYPDDGSDIVMVSDGQGYGITVMEEMTLRVLELGRKLEFRVIYFSH